MAQGTRSPLLPLISIGLLCALGTWLGLRTYGHEFSWPYAVILVWFVGVSMVIITWQERALGPDLRSFMRRFMGGLVLKLLGSLVLLVILILILPDGSKAPLFAVFSLSYLIFLGYSTLRLVGSMRNASAA